MQLKGWPISSFACLLVFRLGCKICLIFQEREKRRRRVLVEQLKSHEAQEVRNVVYQPKLSRLIFPLIWGFINCKA